MMKIFSEISVLRLAPAQECANFDSTSLFNSAVKRRSWGISFRRNGGGFSLGRMLRRPYIANAACTNQAFGSLPTFQYTDSIRMTTNDINACWVITDIPNYRVARFLLDHYDECSDDFRFFRN